MKYTTCCVNSTAEAIDAMTDSAVDLTYEEFIEEAEELDEWATGKGYALDPEDGLILKDDWHVSYHRSTYKGRPCVYICWSSIEFIWV